MPNNLFLLITIFFYITLFKTVHCLNIFNNTNTNLYNIEFIKLPEHLNIGFINNLNIQDNTNIELPSQMPINNLIIKFNGPNQKQIISHIGAITNNGTIKIETLSPITNTTNTNLKAKFYKERI